jgi:ubiquinone/menaquinone biosynthesis C-methylase UbiE
MLSGFRASRILLTAVELDLFSTLAGGGGTAVEVSRATGASERGITILLDAVTALGLIRKKGGRYRNAPVASECLAADGENDWRLGIGHHLALWENWSRLTEVVREGKPLPRTLPRQEGKTRSFIGLMHRHGSARAPRLANAISLRGAFKMLDVGGGSGAYSIAFARKKRDLRVTVLDLPDVLPITREYVTEAGLIGRFDFIGGDLRTVDFGSGYDLVLISAVCHMLSPRTNRRLIGKAFAALSPGGRLLIHDFVLDENRASPPNAAIFAVNMLVNTEGGNSYTANEYRAWLKESGFRSVRFRRLSSVSDFLLATK